MRDDAERFIANIPEALRSRIEEALTSGAIGEQFRKSDGPTASLESLAGLVDRSALEAIVQRYGRPPLLVEDDRVVFDDRDLVDFPPETAGWIRGLEGSLSSVGRIEFLNHPSLSWGGTGWVARRESDTTAVVVTNRHVAKLVARRVRDGSGVFIRTVTGALCGARIDFREEVRSRPGDTTRTAGIVAIDYLADDAAADVALLRLVSDSFAVPAALKLDISPVEPGSLVAVIGYPAYDTRNNLADQARYFTGLYDVKRVAPGRVTQAAEKGAELKHDCTTLGGNSGSPVVDLSKRAVIGLHFSGLYGVNNSAVTAATLERLLAGERPLSVSGANLPMEGRADDHHDAAWFQDRQGFDQRFLEVAETPWPKVAVRLASGLAQPSDHPPEPNELRYTHFGVKYHAGLKLPVLTGVNIDGERAVRIKRGEDQWFTDGRLPVDIQLRSANFKDKLIDRGHMVRREDPNWGPLDSQNPSHQEAIARQADLDTFHYVNAAPQHSLLNQGKTLWQGLENYILNNARTAGFRACVFTGPASMDEDVELDGVVVPLEFWKIVVTRDASGTRLHATAYLLSQGQLIRDLLEKRSHRESLEGFVLGAYRTFQLSVRDLMDATGYDFSAYLPYDVFGAGQEGTEAPEPRMAIIESFADVTF